MDRSAGRSGIVKIFSFSILILFFLTQLLKERERYNLVFTKTLQGGRNIG